MGVILLISNTIWTIFICIREIGISGIVFPHPYWLAHSVAAYISFVLFGMLIGLLIAEQIAPDIDDGESSSLTAPSKKSKKLFPLAQASNNYGTMQGHDLL